MQHVYTHKKTPSGYIFSPVYQYLVLPVVAAQNQLARTSLSCHVILHAPLQIKTTSTNNYPHIQGRLNVFVWGGGCKEQCPQKRKNINMQPTTLMLLPLSALVYQKMANFYQWCHLSQHKHPLSTLLWLSALMKTGAPANISSFFFLYRVIPVNMKNFFFITSKVIKIEPSYQMEKKQNFIRRQK